MSKAPTKRQRAESIVAMVRAAFPHPCQVHIHRSDWYCVGTAYYQYRKTYPEQNLPALVKGFGNKYGGNPREPIPCSIWLPNDEGKFSNSWAALTDEIEKAL